eukprot:3519464-Prymnesium_polylepis.1
MMRAHTTGDCVFPTAREFAGSVPPRVSLSGGAPPHAPLRAAHHVGLELEEQVTCAAVPDLHVTCTRHARDLQVTCTRHARDLHATCTRPARDLHPTCTRPMHTYAHLDVVEELAYALLIEHVAVDATGPAGDLWLPCDLCPVPFDRRPAAHRSIASPASTA